MRTQNRTNRSNTRDTLKALNQLYENDEETNNVGFIELTEANLNRVVNGHDKMDYVILSASRQNLYKTPSGNIYSVPSGEMKHNNNDKELKPGSKEHTDANNVRNKELLSFLRSNHYAYVPVYGGYKEEGQEKASIEKSFIVLPYDWSSGKYLDFNTFAKTLLKESWGKYQQDAILIKYPDRKPDYYDCKTGKPQGLELTSVVLNDLTKEYFTALKKWGDISNKDSGSFTQGEPQRFTFEAFYMNDYPNTMNEHRIRRNKGELVRVKNYPK